MELKNQLTEQTVEHAMRQTMHVAAVVHAKLEATAPWGRLVHSSELWKRSAAFLQHGQREGAQVWILALSGSHELTAGLLLSVSAPHHPA